MRRCAVAEVGRDVAGGTPRKGKDVLHVPSTALFRAGDGWAVFRIAGNRARKAQVGVGERMYRREAARRPMARRRAQSG
jgi:hypothetical protein